MKPHPLRSDTAHFMNGRPISYAVVWRKDDGPIVPGQLQIAGDAIRLRGGTHGRPEEHAVPIAEIAEVRLAHGPGERIHGLPSLLVELRSIERFFVAGIGGFGVVTELADRIAGARALA